MSCLAGAGAALLLACGDGTTPGRGAAPGGASGRHRPALAQAALPVRTEAVQRGEITRFIETHARLQAERWVEVVARAQGLVRRLAAEEGDQVHAGQILVQLEKDELRLQVEAARVASDQAQAAYDRTRALFERQLVSQEEFEGARQARDNAIVARRQAELHLDYADIRSPVDGVVMQRRVEDGDMVRANDVVYVVADLDPLRAEIRIPEKRMIQVQPGQEARIRVDPAPDRVFPATVRRISPGVDPASGTVKVTLDVPRTGPLRPGMFATVRIVTDRHEGTLVIPKKALILETDADDLFAVRDGRAVRVQVTLGYVDGDRVEVLAGLEEGDRVITVGHEGLKDGTPVRDVAATEGVGAGGTGTGGSRRERSGR